MTSACPDKELLLHAFFDGELDAVHALECEAHLKTCPGCAAELRRLQALRDGLSAPGIGYEASADLRERIAAALAREASGEAAPPLRNRTPASRLQRIAPWTLGPALGALAATLILTLSPMATTGGMEQEVIDGHVRSLLAAHLTDVATSNRHTVKPWFNGKVDFAPPVVDLADIGFPLAGGRLDYLRNRPAAALVYRRRAHVINVFVMPGAVHGAPALDRRARGYSLVRWSRGGLTFWAVSDIDLTELEQFRAAFVARTPG